jgi:hypothetical protein
MIDDSKLLTLQLHLSEEDMDASRIQQVTREAAEALDHQAQISARLPEGIMKASKKGDWQSLGTIVMQLAGSGGVIVSLIGVFRTWFERRPKLQIELERADGATLKIRSENFDADQVRQLAKQIESFLQHNNA